MALALIEVDATASLGDRISMIVVKSNIIF